MGGPALPLSCLCAVDACLWLLQRGDSIENINYNFPLAVTCSSLIYKLLVKGHDNILKKVFQMILTTTTEMTELESLFLLDSVVSHIINRSSYFYFLFVL